MVTVGTVTHRLLSAILSGSNTNKEWGAIVQLHFACFQYRASLAELLGLPGIIFRIA